MNTINQLYTKSQNEKIILLFCCVSLNDNLLRCAVTKRKLQIWARKSKYTSQAFQLEITGLAPGFPFLVGMPFAICILCVTKFVLYTFVS